MWVRCWAWPSVPQGSSASVVAWTPPYAAGTSPTPTLIPTILSVSCIVCHPLSAGKKCGCDLFWTPLLFGVGVVVFFFGLATVSLKKCACCELFGGDGGGFVLATMSLEKSVHDVWNSSVVVVVGCWSWFLVYVCSWWLFKIAKNESCALV